MTLVRRIAIGVITFAAGITVVAGLGYGWLTADYAGEHGFDEWAALLTAGSVLSVVLGAGCAYMAARDLRRGSLSDPAMFWTWAATAGLSLLAVASVWFVGLALIAPFVTAVFVWLSRSREDRAPRLG